MLFTSCVPISCVGVSSVQGYLHLLLGDPLGPRDPSDPSDPLGPSDPRGNNLSGVRQDPRVALKSSYKYFPHSTSSLQRLIHPRYRLKILRLIKTFNDEICKEDEGNL